MEITEIITAYGNSLVNSTHRTTFEVTRARDLTETGDCIIAVNADKACKDLTEKLKIFARMFDAEMRITIEAGGEKDTVRAKGHPSLLFSHPTDIVIRKSSYLCNRTLAIKADKAAADLSRELVKNLKKPNQSVKITIIVKVHNP